MKKKKDFYQWDFHDEDGRQVIREWSRNRISKMEGFGKSYNRLLIYTFDVDTLKSFIKNINFMVIIQMALAALSVYLFDRFDISFDFHVSLFVSPIVFPLAFSINTDFQRREKVLEDLASFKAAAMLWFFCMREWKKAAELDDVFLNAVHNKVKNMMFNLREYLLTHKIDRRRFIGRCMYEDFSDTNQLIEQVRASKLPANTSIISRVIHLLNMLCLSFERLRVIREYRSPRSIRSFNKVLIFVLPIILSPYFISIGRKEGSSKWCQYYIAVLVAGVFGALQGVQDKLDDPFDGMSEDDIKLDTIDEWTFHNLENIVNRNFTVGRFHVSANVDQADAASKIRSTTLSDYIPTSPHPATRSRGSGTFTNLRNKLFKRSTRRRQSSRRASSFTHTRRPTDHEPEYPKMDAHNHPYADVLEKIKGNARVQAKKGTGTLLVTDVFTDMNKTSSNSSITSQTSSNKSDEVRRRQISPTVVTFAQRADQIRNLENSSSSSSKKENQTVERAYVTADSNSGGARFEVGKMHSPVSSTASTDSDFDSLTTEWSGHRLLPTSSSSNVDADNNKQRKPTTKTSQHQPSSLSTSRFKLSSTPINNCVELQAMPSPSSSSPAAATTSTTTANNEATLSPAPSEYDVVGEDCREGELNEIVIINRAVNSPVEGGTGEFQ